MSKRFGLLLIALLPVIVLGATAAASQVLAPRETPARQPEGRAAQSTVTPLPSVTPPPAPTPSPRGLIAASLFRNGHWDVYLLSTQGELQKRLTFGEGDNRAPAWSPDGTRIAFESNRGHNWDLYLINADGSNLQRLTTHARFDGSPRWSPDGKRLAFTSDRDGDLDIWVMNADGSGALNLTPKSPVPDYDPVWSPDGKQIAFTTLRDGNKAIYLMNADGSQPRSLSTDKASADEHPAWSPDGRRIAFVAEKDGAREVYALDVAAPQKRQRVTALQYHQWPAWSPDGAGLLFIAQSEHEQSLEYVQFGQPYFTTLSHDRSWYRQPDWSAQASVPYDEASLKRADAPLYVEQTTPNPPSRPDRYNLVPMKNVRVIVPLLSDTVDDSYDALRQRVRAESDWDFLAGLSEAVRPLDFKSNASDFLSWHKAGRAVDFLLDYFTPQGRALEVAREDVLGETYWRLYLKTAKQDGSQGEPLRQVLWDVSETTRARLRGRGGMPKGIFSGYYIDLTELARQYGWQRIPSHTKPDFDWHRDFLALEYWHYQKSDGLSWWQAIHEVYAPAEIGDRFSYQNLTKAKYNVLTMIEKGIPIPPEILQRYSTLEP